MTGPQTRPRPSRIDGLPEPIRERIDALLRGGLSQTEILRRTGPWLSSLGETNISRSALSRRAKRIAELGRRLRERRAVSEQLIGVLGADASRVGEATRELLHAAAFDLAGDGEVDPQRLGQIALAVQRIERAEATSQQRRIEARREVAAEAAEAAEAAGAKAGLSPEIAAAMRAAIEGVAERSPA